MKCDISEMYDNIVTMVLHVWNAATRLDLAMLLSYKPLLQCPNQSQ